MISIKYKNLRLCALVLLAIPSIIFFLSWLKLFVGIPFALLLIGALVYCARQQDERTLSIKASTLIAIVAAVLLWAVLSGQGGFFVQKPDHSIRNAVFRDLINYNWPVRYPSGNDESLVYYIGYWFFPALIGKLGALIGGAKYGWIFGRVALLIWTTISVTVAFLLVCFYVGASRKKFIYTALIVFILFSGMDGLGALYDLEAYANHIEWWAGYFQFSSMSTQLGWVFNQAVPAWIATALMLNEKDKSCYALIGLSILPCSPFPIIGLAIIMLCLALRDFVAALKEKKIGSFFKEVFSIPNIAAVVTLLPTFALYYINNAASNPAYNTEFEQMEAGAVPFLVPLTVVSFVRYFMFVFLEFGILMVFLKNKKNRFISAVIAVSLLVLPIFRVGTAFDFCMRTSIPELFVLMVLLMEFFINYSLEKEKSSDKNSKEFKKLTGKYMAVIIIFIIGCVTPFVEYYSSFNLLIDNGIQIVKKYDDLDSLNDLKIEEKCNFVGENSSESLFYKTIGKS